jgi:hypothetical protein
MAQTVPQAFANARLSLVDDILATAGWQQKSGGWIAPERYRQAIEVTHGRGTWSRYNAIMFMVRADEAVSRGVLSELSA